MSILDNHYLVCYIISMGGHKTKIDLAQLEKELPELNPTKDLYKVLKRGLTKLNWWKNRKRGKPNYGWKNKKLTQE